MIQFDRWKLRLVSTCLWGATVTGCVEALPNGSVDHSDQQALIGKTKQELLACAGKPVGEKTQDDLTVLTYYKEASLLEESFPESRSSFSKVHHGCRATVVLQRDRINEVRYESVPSSYQDEDHCVEIFERCTSP
ncbi:hypothetical protein [Petrachloros mirabilis]